jgi:signal transduction histidine kinase
MLERLLGYGQRRQSAADSFTLGWAGRIGLAAAVGLAYFLAARLAVLLPAEPEGVAVFWPAAGISSGILIALGPRMRSPVAAGVIVATAVVHHILADPLWVGTALGLANAAEALITAGLIERYFGADFSLDRLSQVLALLGAAIAGTVVSAIAGAATYRLLSSSSMLTSWGHWFFSDVVGIIIVAPLIIGLIAAVRQPPPRSELIEGTAALGVLAVMTGIISFLPQEPWDAVLPITWLLPILFWVSVRCRPVIAAMAAFIVCFTIVSTTIYGIGYFGDPSLSLTDRVLGAQASILFVALSANILAALFAERRDSETRLARSNTMLERERGNRLMNIDAVTASIAHEIKQPLTAIAANGGGALALLGKSPPDINEACAALNDIVDDSHRVSNALDGIRSLFKAVDQSRQPVDMNQIARDVLQSIRGELSDHGILVRPEMAYDLPLVEGNASQLHQVIANLVHNAIEAMAETDQNRVLRLITQRRDPGTIAVEVQDSGRGIDPKELDKMFEAFVTTKTHGIGLGLAISRQIVERHNGQLLAWSDGKNGALFQVVLPIRTKDADALSH